jgi:hypothetical protein
VSRETKVGNRRGNFVRNGYMFELRLVAIASLSLERRIRNSLHDSDTFACNRERVAAETLPSTRGILKNVGWR